MRIDLKIIIVLILYTITNQLDEFAIVFLFIIMHDIGHILAGMILKYKFKKINITYSGFNIEFNNYQTDKRIYRIIIALAGPFVNLFFLVIGLFINNEIIFYSNLILFVLNLIPIYPLDGGRILRNLLQYRFNFKKAYDITNIISNMTIVVITAVSSILILKIKNISILIIVLYLWYLNYKENKQKILVDKIYHICKNS